MIGEKEIIERLTRIEVQQGIYNEKIDEMHEVLTGNGNEGVFDQVRQNSTFRKVVYKLIWMVIGVGLINVGVLIAGFFH